MSLKSNTEFSRWRIFFWPIHYCEIKKFLPLFVLYALICFNYSLLKAAKDALIITAPGSGAVSIPFIKIWVILPMALFVTLLLTRLLNKYNQEKVFYIMIGSFLAFFIFFATTLYPLRHIIHPHVMADHIQQLLPQGFQGFISIFRNWSYTLFYVMAELWGTMIMSVLFWTFANEIMKLKDAERIYGLLGVGANIATILSGQIAIILSGDFIQLPFLFGSGRWERYLGLMTIIVSFIGLLIISIFRWYNVCVINKDPSMQKTHHYQKNRCKSVKLGIRKNFAYLIRSKYLLCIAIIVIAFNLATNMIEIIWKDQVALLYPNPSDFNAYMGKVLIAIGALSAFVGFFLCGNIVRKLGWTVSALITPITLLISGIFFFGTFLFKEKFILISWTTMIGVSPLAIAVFFGTIQNIFSRVCKYTLFDTTKEISFIPLNSDFKLQGKTAIDGIGSRLGKTGGSMVHCGLLMFFGTISCSTPFVVILLLFVVCGWVIATQSLGHQFTCLTSQGKKLDIEEKDPTLGERVTPVQNASLIQ